MAVGAASPGAVAQTVLETQLAGVLARSAANMRSMVPLLAEIQRGLNVLGQRSFERAQRIPLKASTVRRKNYARRSRSGRAADLWATRAFAREQAAEGKNVRVLRRQWRKGRNETKTPKANPRILERIGGFIESLSEDGTPFSVRKLEGTDTLKFGTKLGGLWSIFAASGRLDFLVSDTSQDEAIEMIEGAQRRHMAKALERAGADAKWIAEVET